MLSLIYMRAHFALGTWKVAVAGCETKGGRRKIGRGREEGRGATYDIILTSNKYPPGGTKPPSTPGQLQTREGPVLRT